MVRGLPVEVLGDFFRLTYIHNPGAAFGLNLGSPLLHTVVSVVALGVLVYLYRTMKPEERLLRFGLSLVLGGAVGNIIDRVYLHEVVDFFDFSGPWFGVEFPLPGALSSVESIFTPAYLLDGRLGLGFPYVFNIADAGITIGAILLLVDQFLLKRHDSDAG